MMFRSISHYNQKFYEKENCLALFNLISKGPQQCIEHTQEGKGEKEVTIYIRI